MRAALGNSPLRFSLLHVQPHRQGGIAATQTSREALWTSIFHQMTALPWKVGTFLPKGAKATSSLDILLMMFPFLVRFWVAPPNAQG